MLTFFVIIISNIFIGTIFYLVISLKLEKNAAEYRTQKFKKEMDDMIREFNFTAERNITLLENRISQMKQLLKSEKGYNTIDVEINDEGKTEMPVKQQLKGVQERSFSPRTVHLSKEDNLSRQKNNNRNENIFEKSIGQCKLFFQHIAAHFTHSGERKSTVLGEKPRQNVSLDVDDAPFVKDVQTIHQSFNKKEATIDFTVDEKITVAPGHEDGRVYEEAQYRPPHTPEKTRMSEQDISELFQASNDNHTLLCELYEQGYAVETLARCSGVPSGEVRLILNIHGNMRS